MLEPKSRVPQTPVPGTQDTPGLEAGSEKAQELKSSLSGSLSEERALAGGHSLPRRAEHVWELLALSPGAATNSPTHQDPGPC